MHGYAYIYALPDLTNHAYMHRYTCTYAMHDSNQHTQILRGYELVTSSDIHCIWIYASARVCI